MRSSAPLHAPEQILEAVGRDIGIEDLSFDAYGHRALVFASGRHFGFQKIVPGVLIYVAEPIRFDIPGTLMEAMKRAHADQSHWTVQVMLREARGVSRGGNNGNGNGNGNGHDDGGSGSGGYGGGGLQETCLLAMIRLTGKQASVPSAQRALAYLSEWNPSRGDR